MNNKTVEVKAQILAEIFKLFDMQMPDEVTDEILLNLVVKIKSSMTSRQSNSYLSQLGNNENESHGNEKAKKVLVVDDIGVVTYQLKILFRDLGYEVRVAKDIFNALDIFVKDNFDFLVMDLFVSTEQEGFTLLNETKKNITKNNLNTKIIVITASPKAENKVKCLNGGADIFLKKEAGWQDKLVQVVQGFTL